MGSAMRVAEPAGHREGVARPHQPPNKRGIACPMAAQCKGESQLELAQGFLQIIWSAAVLPDRQNRCLSGMLLCRPGECECQTQPTNRK